MDTLEVRGGERIQPDTKMCPLWMRVHVRLERERKVKKGEVHSVYVILLI